MLDYEKKMQDLLADQKERRENLKKEALIYNGLPKDFDPYMIFIGKKVNEVSVSSMYKAKDASEITAIVESFGENIIPSAYYNDGCYHIIPFDEEIDEELQSKFKYINKFVIEAEISSFYGEYPKQSEKLWFFAKIAGELVKIEIELQNFSFVKYSFKKVKGNYVFSLIKDNPSFMRNHVPVVSSGEKDIFLIDNLKEYIK